jgi:hypothetical protein
MFDNVVVRDTPATAAEGIAGLTGQVYGVTTPSSTGIDFLGDHSADCAVCVRIDGLKREVWLSPDLVELVDHAPGTTVQIGNGPELVRGADDTWTAKPGRSGRRGWLFLLLVLLLLAGIYCLNLAAFHAWAASGPPSAAPKWHLRWAGIFLFLAFTLFFTGGWGLWRLRKS